MKSLLTFFSGVAVAIVALWLFVPASSNECAKIITAYDQTQALYEQKLVQQEATLQYALARVAVGREETKKLIQARVVAKAKAEAKAETIEALAARIAPIEKAAKQELSVKSVKAWIFDALPEYKPEWTRALGRR